MKDHKEEGSISDRLDALLLSILKEAKEYEENKLKFMEIYRDGMFDLTTSDIKRGSDSVSHFTDEAVFEPLVVVNCSDDSFVVTAPTKKPVAPQLDAKETQKKEEVRKRKGDEEVASEQWVEPEDDVDAALEEKIKKMKKDPLFILNPIPTANQRRAQKTLRKSLDSVASLCSQQRKVEKMIEEYEALLKEEK